MHKFFTHLLRYIITIAVILWLNPMPFFQLSDDPSILPTIPASDTDNGSTSISSQCNVDSPGFSELSSTQNDDMDISLESTSDTCDQTAMLLFSSDEAVNFNPGSILYSPSTSQDESSSSTPFIHHDASLSTVSQEASLSNTHQRVSITATPQCPSLLTTHKCTDRSTARQLLSMYITYQDASTPPPPPLTILDGSTSHHPATYTGQEFSSVYWSVILYLSPLYVSPSIYWSEFL